MSYKRSNRKIDKRSKSLSIQQRSRSLRDYYKALIKQDRAVANLVWTCTVLPLFVPAFKGGGIRLLETLKIGEKDSAHLGTKMLNLLSNQ